MRPVVLVTGASNDIGASTVVEFASKGYNVIINYDTSYQNAAELEKYVKSVLNVDTMIIKADVSSEFEVRAMIENIIDKFDKIDVLVNNATIIEDKPLMARSVDDFVKTVNTNLIGTFIVSKYASKWMMEKKSGKIINVAAANGIDSYSSGTIDYDATKAGIVSLTKNFAVHLAPYVNVNAVAPGWVDTFTNNNLPIDAIENELHKILLKRFADPQEIAKVIYFLASEEASYINGEVIKVDGGR
jgi:3-oxoacyl-[acyl-carrier protein] reductase